MVIIIIKLHNITPLSKITLIQICMMRFKYLKEYYILINKE